MLQMTVHSIGTTPNLTYFKTTDCYATIKDKVGVAEVTEVEGDEEIMPVKELLRTGRLIRLAIVYESGGKKKTASILAARTKVGDLLSDDEAKQIQGSNYQIGTAVKGVIKRVYVKRDASFS